jgi:predicted outer membrane protein
MSSWVMRIVVLLLISALAAGCSRDHARADVPFDAKRFVLATNQSTIAGIDLGLMAARRGRRPETRQLGSILHRQEGELRSALLALAQQKQIQVTGVPEPRKVALRENLEMLPGEVFDRGYALAMVQDLDALSASFQQASRSNDRELTTFARQNLPHIREQRARASQLLKQLGGSPFS